MTAPEIGPINVLYILPSLNIRGGTPKKTLDLVKHTRNRCFVYVYEDLDETFRRRFEEAGARVIFANGGRRFVSQVRQLVRLIDRHAIQVVQVQFTRGELLASALKKLRPSVKTVFAFVGPFEPPRWKKCFLTRAYKSADSTVYVSRYVKRAKWAQFRVLRTTPGRVIYNGTEAVPARDLRVGEPGPVSLLAVSGLLELKNLEVLIDAMEVIVRGNDMPHVFLNIAGDGPYRTSLEERVSRLGIGSNVRLLGYRDDVGGLLQKSTLFLHPSESEGFGIAVAEAMMAGIPPLVADSGALPELVTHGQTGLALDGADHREWADAILELLANPIRARQLSHNAREAAKRRFSIGTFVEEYQRLYDELCLLRDNDSEEDAAP